MDIKLLVESFDGAERAPIHLCPAGPQCTYFCDLGRRFEFGVGAV